MSLAKLLTFDPAEIAAHNREVDEHDALIDSWIADGAPSPMDLARRALDGPAPAPRRELVPVPDGEWLTTAEVAAIYRWKPKTVRADIREGRLIASGGDGRPYRVRRADAESWATARREPTQRTRSRTSRRPARRPQGSTFKEMVQR